METKDTSLQVAAPANTPAPIERKAEVPPALELIWSRFNTWDYTANMLKGTIKTWRWRVLLFMILGAFAGVLSATFAQYMQGDTLTAHVFQFLSQGTAFLSTIFVAFAAFAGSEILTDEVEKSQSSSRVLAEQLRSESYLYIFGAEPYDKENPNVAFERINTFSKITAEVASSSISKEQEEKGMPNPAMTIDDYIKVRVNDQVYGYYVPKVQSLQKKIKQGKNLTFALGFTGVILGALASSGLSQYTAAWIAFVTSASASIASYMATNRYSYLIISYQATTAHLQVLLAKWKQLSHKDQAAVQDFVSKCEAEFTRESAAWMAELTREQDENESLTKQAMKMNESSQEKAKERLEKKAPKEEHKQPAIQTHAAVTESTVTDMSVSEIAATELATETVIEHATEQVAEHATEQISEENFVQTETEHSGENIKTSANAFDDAEAIG